METDFNKKNNRIVTFNLSANKIYNIQKRATLSFDEIIFETIIQNSESPAFREQLDSSCMTERVLQDDRGNQNSGSLKEQLDSSCMTERVLQDDRGNQNSASLKEQLGSSCMTKCIFQDDIENINDSTTTNLEDCFTAKSYGDLEIVIDAIPSEFEENISERIIKFNSIINIFDNPIQLVHKSEKINSGEFPKIKENPFIKNDKK